MDIFIYVSLLVAAMSHAGWNAVVKSGTSKLHGMALVGVFTSLVSMCFLPFANILAWDVYLWIGFSLLVHFAYKLCLTEAYKIGDFAQIYPIARGSAPLMVLLGAFFILGERISLLATGFIIILVLGVCLASYSGSGSFQVQRKAVLLALATAFFIACYTVIDGIGVRNSGDIFSYIIWLMVLDGALFSLYAYRKSGNELFIHLRYYWKSGVMGGSLSLLAYGIALWAITQVPMALVAGLRETSILFAIFLAWLFVKEKINRYQILAGALIVCGVIGIKFV